MAKKKKNWEEKGRVLSRRLYRFEFALYALSLSSILYLSLVLFSDVGYFRKTLVLLFGIGGISSFHFLFQRLWELWAELHDRMESSQESAGGIKEEEVSPLIKSTIKIVFSSEDDAFRKKHVLFLQKKVTALTGTSCEIVEIKTAPETLSYVTDHIVHLVILDSHYQNEFCAEWASSIKKLDKNIPVVVCSPKARIDCPSLDAWFSYLQRDTDVEKLLPYFLARGTINGTRQALS